MLIRYSLGGRWLVPNTRPSFPEMDDIGDGKPQADRNKNRSDGVGISSDDPPDAATKVLPTSPTKKFAASTGTTAKGSEERNTESKPKNTDEFERAMDELGIDELPTYVREMESILTFPEKLMLMMVHIQRKSIQMGRRMTEESIYWTQNGRGFVIKDAAVLTSSWLYGFFGKLHYSSFTRKLYRWGFRKSSPDDFGINDPTTIVFYNPNFVRDDTSKLCHMCSTTAAKSRRHSNKSPALKNAPTASASASSTAGTLALPVSGRASDLIKYPSPPAGGAETGQLVSSLSHPLVQNFLQTAMSSAMSQEQLTQTLAQASQILLPAGSHQTATPGVVHPPPLPHSAPVGESNAAGLDRQSAQQLRSQQSRGTVAPAPSNEDLAIHQQLAALHQRIAAASIPQSQQTVGGSEAVFRRIIQEATLQAHIQQQQQQHEQTQRQLLQPQQLPTTNHQQYQQTHQLLFQQQQPQQQPLHFPQQPLHHQSQFPVSAPPEQLPPQSQQQQQQTPDPQSQRQQDALNAILQALLRRRNPNPPG